MRTNICLSPGWRGALRLVLIVLLLALNAAAVPADWVENGAAAAPLASAEMAPPLLQFTAGGHVIGFAPTQVILAAFDHALRVEFIGTTGVTPVAAGAEAAASDDGPTMGRAQPLGVVTYPDLWPGISVEYRASEGGIVKSTYTLAPGADVAQIRLRYNVPAESQGDGSLQFSFGRGVIIESAPIAWQEIDGVRVTVPVAFYLPSPDRRGAGGEVAFHLGAYDPRYPLTIDPNYVWHTFYGSSSYGDEGNGIAVDGSGNVYITGESEAPWQGDNNTPPLHAHSGNWDIVVVKLNSAGAYQWHTFYGSDAWDKGFSIAVDGSGNLYITGESQATWQGPNGEPPKHAHSSGINHDIVVVKLTSAGAYQWHTFYGSFGVMDAGNGIAVDGSSNVYITGESEATWGAPLHAHSGAIDIVIVKLTSAGAYQWHTFYGSGFGWDTGRDIAVDGSGNLYITGYSLYTWQGGDYLNPINPLHPHSGFVDIVVVKLTSAGAYQWHTFYGSDSDWDMGHDIAVDGSGNVYITGYSGATWQGDNNTNPLHAHSGGHTDIVALKLNSEGEYQWHTFYGSSMDEGNGIAVDGGNVYVTGESYDTWQGDDGANPLHAYSGGNDIVVLKLLGTPIQLHRFYLPLVLRGN